MVYSTSRCPHCKGIVKRETNPKKEIGNPYEMCPYCNNYYLNSYRKEWVTMSASERFFQFVSGLSIGFGFLMGTIIGAAIFPLDNNSNAPFVFLTILISICLTMLLSYYLRVENVKAEIKKSIIRTNKEEYLLLLKNSGYHFYSVEKYNYLVADETIEDKEVAISENEKKISGDLFNKAEKAESTNIEIAVDLYIESGEKGNSEAYMSLGYIYLNGKEGVRKNKTRALKYFREAELLGNEFAQKAIEKIKSEEKNSDKRN